MFYNYFNKFVTGLGLNRAVFVGETQPKRAPEDVVSIKKMDEEIKKYDKGEVIMAAGLTTEEYNEKMKEMAEKDKETLAKIEEEHEKQKEVAALRDKKLVRPATRKKEPSAVLPPEPTSAEIAEREVNKVIGGWEAEQELAALGVGEKPKKAAPMTDQERLAMITEGAAKAEYAAIEEAKPQIEFTPAEVAVSLIKEIIDNPNTDFTRLAKVLAKVTDKIAASLASTGKIDELNITKGFTEEDLNLAQIFVEVTKEAQNNNLAWVNNPSGNDIAQIIYTQYLMDILKKSGKNMNYIGGLFKHEMPNLVV